jgi:hypothetical protein
MTRVALPPGVVDRSGYDVEAEAAQRQAAGAPGEGADQVKAESAKAEAPKAEEKPASKLRADGQPYGSPPPGAVPRDLWIELLPRLLKSSAPFWNERAPWLSLFSMEVEGYVEAAGALYDSCADVEWLHFMLKGDGVWLPRFVAIFGFAFVVGGAVVATKKARAEAAAAAVAKDVTPPKPEPAGAA